ncbi:MAG: uroporphyrinogen decarboxylase [Fimbriimonadaceae bacterium]|nr:uroporphyrinogen decarboxylase [Chitinophagales bacterium]
MNDITFASMQNDLLLRTARGEKVERPPVWLMRQAGRILPEYHALREKVNGFKALVENAELVCEVTLQPVKALGVDAAILFSDILVIPEAMGLPYQMIESKGPWFEKTIDEKKDIDKLKIAEADDLQFVMEGVKLIKKELNNTIPLIGFAGAPWTIFAYMTEGKGSKTFSKARTFLYREPEAAHNLLNKITDSTINYLQGQIISGVDIIQLFDSWAGILSPQQYKEFSLPYIERICNAIPAVPKIVFPKGAYFALEDFAKINCDVIGLDWNMDILNSKKIIGAEKVLQGNLDPCLLFADVNRIKKETIKMLSDFGGKHIANLGHGVYPDTPLDGVRCFIDAIKGFNY